ncbi:FecR family protein [Compostibacter hankyongensis]|uniref:DUF4974 domain-containing protein n=1 Tax=Compostibacter hankyongensis TaxID=1007089 RepID=A0ABP8FJQ7_9BACT
MTKKQFIRILHKYRRSKATEKECRFIETYYALFDGEPGTEDDLTREEREELKQRIKNQVWENIYNHEASQAKERKLFVRPARIAAAVLMLLAAGVFCYLMTRRAPGHKNALAKRETGRYENNVSPGGHKAVLTLSNGQQVTLGNSSAGVLAKQGGVIIRKQDSGELVYHNASGEAATGQVYYNTITTPQGGEYKIVLSDGTKVWLNARTVLLYPTAFTGNVRRITLSGEAYFEVAQEEHTPFIVEAGHTKIQVLGTHFNVNAYEDEGAVRTTLSEGAVRVSAGKESRLLKPGEQASLNNRTGRLKVKPADVDRALAWKNGLFYFNNTDIQTILREVARWYDVEIVYQAKDLEGKRFSGVMSRYAEVSALLERLELTGTVHFKVEGRTIIVLD